MSPLERYHATLPLGPTVWPGRWRPRKRRKFERSLAWLAEVGGRLDLRAFDRAGGHPGGAVQLHEEVQALVTRREAELLRMEAWEELRAEDERRRYLQLEERAERLRRGELAPREPVRVPERVDAYARAWQHPRGIAFGNASGWPGGASSYRPAPRLEPCTVDHLRLDLECSRGTRGCDAPHPLG